jgi:two-component system, LuxR family, response regulator FixJ
LFYLCTRRNRVMGDETTVFVVDDDPAVLRSLVALIKIIFPRVEPFVSANDFLAAYDPERPGCLVLDVAMPGMSGLELQRRLVQERIDLPIVFITGHGNVRMAVGAMQSGAINFLEKPFHDQELWDSIRRALEQDEQARRRRARRAEVEERFDHLTPGEEDVMNLILEGKYNKEIASQLSLSIRTVEDRRARLMKKMRAESVAQLVQLALTR